MICVKVASAKLSVPSAQTGWTKTETVIAWAWGGVQTVVIVRSARIVAIVLTVSVAQNPSVLTSVMVVRPAGIVRTLRFWSTVMVVPDVIIVPTVPV